MTLNIILNGVIQRDCMTKRILSRHIEPVFSVHTTKTLRLLTHTALNFKPSYHYMIKLLDILLAKLRQAIERL